MVDGIKTTLDYIDNIIVDGNPFAKPANEYFALISLRSGLRHLYHFVKKCDILAMQQIDPKEVNILFGNFPLLKGIPYPLLNCAFHWYSISACQYVRTIGAIAHLHDTSRPKSYEYVKSVIPEVLAFRDKVAAHFAWSSKNSQDNEAERLASIIPQPSFSDNSFQVGTFMVSIRSGRKSSSSKEIIPWSITKIHKRLQERYWPEELGD